MNRTPLPDTGRSREDVLQALRAFADDDPDYQHGRLWSLVYYLDEGYADFLGAAYQSFSSANGLNPTAFKSLKRFETEIIAATADLLHGSEEVCGVVTSGGTESCLLAAKTYRDMARAKRRVTKPEMIVPVTAHVAWFKAAEYFGVKLRLLPLGADLRADVGKLEKMIDRNTVMILGSAPEYPHGLIDPIEAMGEIAQRHGIPLHVDACVGGFILPFMEMNGVALAAVGLPRARRHLDLGRPAQVRLRCQGRVDDHLPQPGLPEASDVRLPGLAGRRVRLACPAGHPPRRRLCRGLGGDAALRQVRLSRPGTAHDRGVRSPEARHRRDARAARARRPAGPAARLRRARPGRRTSMPSATRWTPAAGRSTGCSSPKVCTRW